MTKPKYTNTDPFQPWNDPMARDDPFAPWNDSFKKDSPFEPWNSPVGSYKDMDPQDKDYVKKYGYYKD